MNERNEKRIVRLMGIGFDGNDGHVRITQGDRYDVFMGSEQSHEYLHDLIRRVEEAVELRGLRWDELTPSKLSEILENMIQ